MPAPQPKRMIVILFSRFGPYHIARLEAAGMRARKSGEAVVGVEITASGGTYAWDDVVDPVCNFERVTLFSGRKYQSLSKVKVTNAVISALDRIDPHAVAIPGWSSAEAVAALRWCRKNKRRAICMSCSKADDTRRSFLKEWIKRQLVRRFDAALVGGVPHVSYIATLGIDRERIALGYNAVDNEYFIRETAKVRVNQAQWQEKLGLPDYFFLIVARFIPVKNLKRLLDAYHLYQSRCSAPWSLVIAGGGELETELRAQANQLGLQDVYWPGFVQYPDLPKYYGLASAMLFPSIKDTWGLAVNEAMAAGLPVLVSKKAGCSYDLVEDGVNGFLLDPFDVEDMAACMTRMSSLSVAEREVMGTHSRKIIANWGPDRFASGLLQAIDAASGQCHTIDP